MKKVLEKLNNLSTTEQVLYGIALTATVGGIAYVATMKKDDKGKGKSDTFRIPGKSNPGNSNPSTQTRYVTPKKEYANIRNCPSVNHCEDTKQQSIVTFKLEKGKKLKVLDGRYEEIRELGFDERYMWYEVELVAGQTGWVRDDVITFTSLEGLVNTSKPSAFAHSRNPALEGFHKTDFKKKPSAL